MHRVAALTSRRRVLSFAVVLLSGVGIAACINMLARQRHIRALYQDCPFGDGIAYCHMALGHPAARPWSQRPLVPTLARAFTPVLTVADSFLVVSLFGFALTIVGIVMLGRIVAARSGIPLSAGQIVTVAVLVWGMSPFALRFVLTAPTLTDELATGLIVLWLACLLWPQLRPRVFILAPAVAVLATLAREAALITIVATCIVALGLRLIDSMTMFVNCAWTALAFIFDLTRPSSGQSGSELGMSTLRAWLHHPRDILPALFVGIGFTLIALLPTVLLRLARRLPDPRFVYVLLPAAVIPIVLSAFTGSDHSRLSSVAAPVIAVLFALYVVTAATTAQIVLIAAAATVVIHEWRIFTTLARPSMSYVLYFTGLFTFRGSALPMFAALALAVVVLDCIELRREKPPGRKAEGHSNRAALVRR